MNLKDIDLNLLLVLHEVLVQRRVSKVAETLGLSQPAVSNALARLRKLLGDDLVVPTSRGMEPTPFAVNLREPLGAALGLLQGALNQSEQFDAATSQRAFKLGMTDIGEIYFLPQLMGHLLGEAPGVSVSTVRNNARNLKEDMEAGHVDLALGLLPTLKAGFLQRRLFAQRYVCLFRQAHPLGKAPLTLARFAAADHVVVVSQGTGHGTVEDVLARLCPGRNIRLTVPHYVAVGHLLQHSDMVATVPERFAHGIAPQFGLTYVAHPAPLPEITINLFWHAKFHKDPANQWLRHLLVRLHGSPA